MLSTQLHALSHDIVSHRIAKSIVAAGLLDRCRFHVSYGFGIYEPLSIFVYTYGAGTRLDAEITVVAKKNFDLRIASCIQQLSGRDAEREKVNKSRLAR